MICIHQICNSQGEKEGYGASRWENMGWQENIQANIAQFNSNKSVTKVQVRPSDGWKATPQLPFQVEVFPEKEKASVAEGKFNRLHSKAAGWIVEERARRGVRVAAWVIKEQKTYLYCSLV